MPQQGQFTAADVDAPKQQGQFTANDVDQPADTYRGGFLPTVGSDIWGATKGLVGLGATAVLRGMGLNTTQMQNLGFTPVNPAQPILDARQEWAARKAAGYNLPYRLAAPIPEIAGTNVQGMEEAARHGDIGGVLGHATVGAGLAAAPVITEGALRVGNKIIPSTTRAAAGLKAIEAAHGDAPVPVQAAHAAATDIVNRMAVTGENAHPLVHAYLDRAMATDLANTHPEIAGELGQQGIPTQNPLTFAEARQFLKRANELKYEGNPGAATKNQLSQFAAALDQDVNAAAAQGGFLDDYAKTRKEYARGKGVVRAAEKVGPYLGAAAGYELGRKAGQPIGGMMIGGMAGRALAEPVVGGMVRSVIERGGGVPNISAVPAPPEGTVTAPPAPPVEATGRRVTNESVPIEHRSGVERRTDAAARAKFAAMTPEQQYQTAFTNHVTGMPNARAMEAAGPAPAHGFSDVAGLKWLNDTYGQEAGNALLQAKARALQDAGIQSYHTGGDEFSHLSQNPVDLNNRLAAANQNLRQAVIEVTDPVSGKKQYYNGAEFRYGVGPDAKTAETNMLARKAAQKSTRGTQGTLRQVPAPPAEVTQ